jgi:outer membrane protein assembly factor BamB
LEAAVRWIALVILLLAIAGCGSGDGLPVGEPHGLPPLPLTSTAPDLMPVRAAAMELNLSIPGASFVPGLKSADATVVETSLLLAADGNDLAWAVYEIPGLAADFRPLEIEFEVLEQDRQYFLALANYNERRWEVLPEPYEGNDAIGFTGGWPRYLSPADSVYFAVLVFGPQLTYQRARVTIDDTRPLPAPRGLAAEPLSGAAELTWQLYTDFRADELRIWQADNEGMIDAVQAGAAGPAVTTRTIEGLTNGHTYYFALTAYISLDGLESPLGNVASCTPTGGTGGGPLTGIWPRLGNREDSRGVGELIGPYDFENWDSDNVADGRETVRNRTSPVIDSDGRVYALAADGVLVCYSADLETRHWKFAASEHGTPGASYVCPPHSPCIDSAGNVYFVAAPVSTSAGTPYLFCVTKRGERGWRFDMGTVSDDISVAYPTPNITADGTVIAVIKENHVIIGIKDGTEDWIYELGEAECHADPALSGDMLELPIWDRGIGIPESRLHWLRIDATSGDFAADYRDMGALENLYGGLPLHGSYHVYPERENLTLLDATTGTRIESEPLPLSLTASPARSEDSRWLFQPHPPFGFAGTAYLHVVSVSNSEPPTLTDEYSLQLGQASITGKPAVDGEGKIYLADSMGKLYIIEFDQSVPPGPDNPNIMDEQALGRSDTYFFNSVAIGDGAIYVVTEQNVLYRVYMREEL